MIYDMMYRDGANYKQYFRADFPTKKVDGEEVEMEVSGMTVGAFFKHMGWSYDPEYDHNLLIVLNFSEDQDTYPDVIIQKGAEQPKRKHKIMDAEEVKRLIKEEGLQITTVIDAIIELNGIVGVGFITFAEEVTNYIHSKGKKIN